MTINVEKRGMKFGMTVKEVVKGCEMAERCSLSRLMLVVVVGAQTGRNGKRERSLNDVRQAANEMTFPKTCNN